MTKVNNYQRKVTREELIKAIKTYRKKDATRTVGMEMERFILKEDGTLPDARTHDVLYIALRKSLGENASVEPGAHMIEIKTGVHKEAVSLHREMSETFAALRREAKEGRSCNIRAKKGGQSRPPFFFYCSEFYIFTRTPAPTAIW